MFRFGLLFRGFQTDMPPPASTIGTSLSIKTPRGNWTTKPDIGAGLHVLGRTRSEEKDPGASF